MGDMADFAIEGVIEMENLRDQYVNGDMSMQEAFDHGFLDPMGGEQEGIDDAWNRSFIPSKDNLDQELRKQSDQMTIAMQAHEINANIGRPPTYQEVGPERRKQDAAPRPELPSCSVCGQDMPARDGRYGKFYYCVNHCSNQKCVSDKYWQSVR
jgi:hypothetical protein